VANQKIFCNTPWYELHIYWDGSLGICCQEAHKLYNSGNYNIATMSIAEWFNSEPVRKFRQQILGNNTVSACARCTLEEQHNTSSRRIRSNQKSVIFTRSAFDHSFEQSPGRKHFVESGLTTTQPIDLHIDLGNYCNLACKMCNAQASSVIASQEVQWGIASSRQYLGTDWTKNQQVWDDFKQQLLNIPNLNNIHFMGGETLLTDRVEDLVDTMLAAQRFDICFSFVTNGTVLRPQLINKLSKFRRVGIEISIETIDEHNAYQRQGTDTKAVLRNIDQYQQLCNGTSITVTLRPAPSALTIGYYPSLLKYALDKKLVIKSNLCYEPEFLYAGVLPDNIKALYLGKYQQLLSEIESVKDQIDYNTSDPNNYQLIVKEQAESCKSILQSPAPDNADQLLKQLVEHCRKWDQVYNMDARTLYPEWQELLDRHGY
jgi:organic radical activating enzyme